MSIANNLEQSDLEIQLHKCMKEFDHFFLKNYSKKQLEAYFRYTLTKNKPPVQLLQNFKLIGSQKECQVFVDTFAKVMNLLSPGYQIYRISEKPLLMATSSDLPEGDNYALFIESDSEKLLSDEEQRQWKRFVTFMEDHPRRIHFLYSPTNKLWQRFRESNEYLFYRAFPKQIIFTEPDTQTLLDLFIDGMTEMGFTFKEDFIPQMLLYIETVYPTAQKHGYEFVEDLEKRVLEKYFEKPADGIIDLSLIPYSKMVENIIKTRDIPIPTAVPEQSESSAPAAIITDLPIPAFHADSQKREVKSCKRILILALSIFPASGEMSLMNYKYSGEEDIVSGYYQLEPIPKLLLKKNEPADEIIILSSGDTRKAPKNADGSLKGLYLCNHKVKQQKLVTEEDPSAGVSPLDFFVYQVTQAYSSYNKQTPYFHVVEIPDDIADVASNNATILAMKNVLSEIRENEGASIYADIHGGPRDAQQLVSNILYLANLEDRKKVQEHTISLNGVELSAYQERILPENIYTADRGIIRNAGITLSILDFVSGINDLTNNGKPGSLDEFIKNNPASEDERTVISKLNDIAFSIQFCDIYQFEASLGKLKKTLPAYQVSDQGDYLSLFADSIESDYHAILQEKPDVIAEIAWCLKKGFYQQVLTLIENKIPYFLNTYPIKKPAFCFDEEILGCIKNNDRSSHPGDPDALDVFNQCVKFLVTPKQCQMSLSNLGAHPVLGKEDKAVTWYPPFHAFCKDPEMQTILRYHFVFKSLRNHSNHADNKKEITIKEKVFVDSVKRYLSAITDILESDETITKGPLIKVYKG